MGKYTLDFTASEINNRLSKLDNTPISMELVWVNADAGSQFAAQTLNVDINGYDLIAVIYALAAGSANTSIEILPPAFETTLKIDSDVRSSGNVYISSRYMYLGRDGIVFGTGGYKYITSAAFTESNHYLVPYRIYGIKGVQ